MKVSLTLNPNFWIILANFFEASNASSSFLAPVQTIFPELNISAVLLGSRIRIITPLNRAGLYSELRVRELIRVKFKRTPKSIVATQFLKENENV